MADTRVTNRIPSEWLAVLLVAVIVGLVALCLGFFNRAFFPGVTVTLTSNRSGLVMEPNSKVKMRGVVVGHVAQVSGGTNPITLTMEIDPEQIEHIPANVQARISSTSIFGSKYVDLLTPPDPSPQRLAAGAVLTSQNVTVEVNTVFQNLVVLLEQIDPAKLNAILSALAEGVRGQGERVGEATVAANEVLLQVNPRAETLRADLRALASVGDIYSGAAGDILNILSAVTTTGKTVANQRTEMDALLLNVIGLSRSGTDLLGASKGNLVQTINLLEPTTNLLETYNPSLTCLLLGAKKTLDDGLTDYAGGADGKSLIMDAGLLLGDDPYRYPDNLPITAARGGPGGKPGCGSLPDVGLNWPVRALVANTGFGTGLDYRPNPGIGFPGYANYFPVTRAVPEEPSIRNPGGPAPGPVPHPGAPPYGAPKSEPEDTPRYPGVPAPPETLPTPAHSLPNSPAEEGE